MAYNSPQLLDQSHIHTWVLYWVTQKLPQICTVILRICIGKVAWFHASNRNTVKAHGRKRAICRSCKLFFLHLPSYTVIINHYKRLGKGGGCIDVCGNGGECIDGLGNRLSILQLIYIRETSLYNSFVIHRCGNGGGCIDGLENRLSFLQLIYIRETSLYNSFVIDAVTAESVLTVWETVSPVSANPVGPGQPACKTSTNVRYGHETGANCRLTAQIYRLLS